MRKKVFKDTIRIVLGLFTLLWGLVAWAALYPDEDYHHCESGQDEMSATTCVIIACASLLMFCLVWYGISGTGQLIQLLSVNQSPPDCFINDLPLLRDSLRLLSKGDEKNSGLLDIIFLCCF